MTNYDPSPTAADAYAYRLGIRVAQAYREHQGGRPSNADYLSADCIETAIYSLDLLKEAFNTLALSAGVPDALARQGRRLIEACCETWRDWSRLSFVEFRAFVIDCPDDDVVADQLEKLEGLLERIFKNMPQAATASWYNVGWSAAINGWHDEITEELQDLIGQSSVVTLADFHPPLEENSENMGLLPYRPDHDWHWFRLEAGLRKLFQTLAIPQPDSSKHNSTQDAEKPVLQQKLTAPQTDSLEETGGRPPEVYEYLGLKLDVGRHCVTHGDQSEEITQPSHVTFLRLLLRNGEIATKFAELEKLVRELCGQRRAISTVFCGRLGSRSGISVVMDTGLSCAKRQALIISTDQTPDQGELARKRSLRARRWEPLHRGASDPRRILPSAFQTVSQLC